MDRGLHAACPDRLQIAVDTGVYTGSKRDWKNTWIKEK